MTNIVLDYVFIVPMDMGIAGAGLGTAGGYAVSTAAGLLFFLRFRKETHSRKGTHSRRGTLRLLRPRFDGRLLLKSCLNGSSEMVSECSTGVTTLLLNLATLRYLGVDGVAAITIILYGHFLLNSVYLGFVCGIAPAVSYHYGAGRHDLLRRIVRYSRNFLFVSAAAVFAASVAGAPALIGAFAPPSSPVYPIALHGMLLFSACFLFIGTNVFASGLFTAFGNGPVSAASSFLRALVFPVAAVALLPVFLGGDGIWLSIPAAELATLGFSLFFLFRFRRFYGYAKGRALPRAKGDPAAKTLGRNEIF